MNKGGKMKESKILKGLAETNKLTKKQLCKHIRDNSENTYSLVVELSAIYLKLYGELPKGIGLSGQQAEFATNFAVRLP